MFTLAKWSISDYHQMIEAGILAERQVELLAGEIIEVSPKSPTHYMLGEDNSEYLKQLLKGKAYVRFDGPITLYDSEPEPDIAIVRLPREQYRQRHPYPEDIFLIIEISDSTLAKDLNQKKAIYAKANILEYWVLDLKIPKLLIFREPQQNNYRFKQEKSTGIITLLAFPDVEISIDKLLQSLT